MATYQTGPNGHMMNGPGGFVSIVSASMPSMSEIDTVLSNGHTEKYLGIFSVANNAASGIITSYQNYNADGSMDFSISGLFMTIAQHDAYANANNISGLWSAYFPGHDTYVSSSNASAHDYLIGNGGNDTYLGGAGTVSFQTRTGANTITGGSGMDTVAFTGARSQYSVTQNSDGSITVADSNPFRNGTDHISHVGYLQFTDQTDFVYSGDQDAASIARLYIAALGRQPDGPGLQGWENAYKASVTPTDRAADPGSTGYRALATDTLSATGQSVAWSFTHSQEFQQDYGSLDDTGFVTQLYHNVLGRAPDSAGLQGWVNGIEGAAHLTREQVLVGFATSTENIANTAHLILPV
jgi:hypothetical protein